MAERKRNWYNNSKDENPLSSGVHKVPMPKDVFDNFDNEFGDKGKAALDKYESTVDEFIKSKNLKAGDRFQVDHPEEGPRTYEVLSPENAGRKNWYQIPKQPDAPTS